MESVLRRYWLFWLFTATGLLFFSYHYLDDLARQNGGSALPRFIEEMTGAYAAMVLMPFVIALVRRFPFTLQRWPAAALAQVGGLASYSAIHTTLLSISRGVIFPLAGLGPYHYGVMSYRYPMELSHDAIIYPITVLLIFLFDRLTVARRAEVAAARLQGELAEAKLENLRLQLHPHFLFNTLNAISAVMYEDVGKADAMLVRLSEFLRVILNSTDVAEIPFEEELQIEGMYLAIMKARLETGLRLSVDVKDDAAKAMVPSLILQPLIENSIQHGRGSSAEGLDVTIAAHRQNGAIQISVSDNGVGLTAGHSSSGSGKGIANVKSRLAHLYGEHFEFAMHEKPAGGTQTTISFPFRAV